MAQDYESPFKPIVSGSDYLSGSVFGQVAGALLSRRDKQVKRQAQKALLASAIIETFGQLQRNQKQGVVDSINETNEKYSDVFKINEEEYTNFNRKEVDEYIKSPENFLNKKAVEKFNTSDFAINNDITYQNRNDEPKEIRKGILQTIDNFKKEIKQEYDILKDNPMYTSKTFIEYNKKAKEEYLSAINLIQNDPTRKNLVKAAFNKIFGTAPDGTKRFGMAEKAELEKTLDTATKERTTFRERINKSEEDLKTFYNTLMPSEVSEFDLNIIKNKNKVFKSSEIENKVNNTIGYFVDNKGEYTNFASDISLELEISGKTIDIKKKIINGKIKVLNKKGEEEPLSQNILYESIGLKRLNMENAAIQNNNNPIVGPSSIHAALISFNNNNRFKVDGNNIIFTPPGTDIKSSLDPDDKAALLNKNGNPLDETNEREYSIANMFNIFQSEEFLEASEEDRRESVDYLKNEHPENAEEIEMIYNSTLEDLIKYEEENLKEFSQKGFRKLFPESMFRSVDLEKLQDL